MNARPLLSVPLVSCLVAVLSALFLAAVPPAFADEPDSAEVLRRLEAFLQKEPGARNLDDLRPIAQIPLTREDAEAANEALWHEAVDRLWTERAEEHEAQTLTYGDYVLRYETVVLGDVDSSDGPSDLFISMHGGGGGPAEMNDQQWRNQIALGEDYAPVNAFWVAPRAPTNEWNMWFRDEIDVLFARLVTNFIVFEDIDPDRVYLFGYSAGADGVYGLATRTADRWAGAAASAGHPNGVSFANLRNLAFAIHTGGDDGAYQRNEVARQSIGQFAALRAADPEGYPFQGQVHAGQPHWMNLADAVAIPFLQDHTRDPIPPRVVWEYREKGQPFFYWLGTRGGLGPGNRVVASYESQQVTIEEATGVSSLTIFLDDWMLDLDQDVRVVYQGKALFQGYVVRTLDTLLATRDMRLDPSMIFPASLEISLPSR